MSTSARSSLALVLCLGLAGAAPAIQPPAGDTVSGSAGGLLSRPPSVVQATDSARDAELAAQDPALAAFRVEAGGTWHARYDARTARPALIWGSGLPWLPGRGNELTWRNAAGSEKVPTTAEVRATLEAKARELVSRHPGLFRVPAGAALVLDERRTVAVDAGRKWQVWLGIEKDGVPVERAGLVFRLSHGNLVQLGSLAVGDALAEAASAARIDGSRAVALAQAHLDAVLAKADPSGAKRSFDRAAAPGGLVDAGTLHVVPWTDGGRAFDGDFGRGLDYRLAWRVALRLPGGLETWTAEVDAVRGEVLALWDANAYACPPVAQPQGRVTGGVYLGPIEEVPESLRGMPHPLVVHGGALDADYNGLFAVTAGVPAETGLNGSFFNMECAGCTNPPQVFARNDAGGNLPLGFGGVDQVGNGSSTRAERNCFFHLGAVRALASKHLDDAATGGFLSRNMPARVNIAATCNAFFDGNGVNFFRSGGGCNNTGEIADVMQHEWGHALDSATGYGGDGSRGEGLSDVVAFMATHDARLGPYFVRGDARGIRNADEAVDGLLTLGNVTANCPSVGGGGDGPGGTEVHCEGIITSQTWWHLARELRLAKGEVPGWWLAEKLFFQSLPVSDTFIPDQATSMYDGTILVDDDDGNLSNGTPNGSFVDEAFLHHEIASTPQVGDSPDCTPAPAPSVSLLSRSNPATSLWQVEVSWDAVPAAVEYRVVRNDALGLGGDVPVATVFPPTTVHLDDNVTDGVTYRYRVLAFDAAGCLASGDNQQQVTVAAFAQLSVVSHAVDDSLGNANGWADPGETLNVEVTVGNVGAGPATGVVGTLSSTDLGVLVLRDTAAFGDLAPTATAATAAPHFQVLIDPAAACGSFVSLTLELESAEGCSTGGFRVPIGVLAGYEVVFADDFETDRGWIVDPEGSDTATAGLWQRADPAGTNFGTQPEDDHTPAPGTRCWVTGPAGGNPGADDVDDGCTTLQGPIIDLAGQTGLELSYWRWFHISRELDDDLLVEISNDGGAAWRELERLSEPSEPWEEAIFDLDAALGEPADRVVLRLTICDTNPGSLIEVLLDDLSMRRPLFDCESPDPRPRVDYVIHAAVDDPGQPGVDANANGQVDPGETFQLTVDVTNTGNLLASNVRATIALLAAPLDTIVLDDQAAWPDVAVGATETSGAGPSPHFLLELPWSARCDEAIDVLLSGTYDGPSGAYPFEQVIRIPLGTVVENTVLADSFETADPADLDGWTHDTDCTGGGCDPQDDWQRGVPGGASTWDPAVAFDGSQIWANDLGGVIGGQPWDGNYRGGVDNWLESPPIDCSALRGTTLRFMRWLSVEDGAYDRAAIEVNGVEVWRNPVGADLIDTAWTPQEIDISAIADGNPDVRVRFTLTADGGLQYGGWAIDLFSVLSAESQCEPWCGAAATVPPRVGWTSLRARASGPAGVELLWSGETLAADEEFRLYRGTRPDQLDLLLTPPLHAATSWTDGAAPALGFYRATRAGCAGEAPLAPAP